MTSDDRPATVAAITRGVVRRLIATQFPQWAGLPVQPVAESGWDNVTFRLGEELSVRLPSAQRYAAQVAKEHRWVPRLAPHLPLPISEPVAQGAPGEGYPWPWSIYRWLDGTPATCAHIADLPSFAASLAGFLAALQRVDVAGGPLAGPHSFYRGGDLRVYDSETRHAIGALRGRIDAAAATAVWEAALTVPSQGPPVWVHGDVAAPNLLVRAGRLSAVIDFGCCAIGDPACDLTIAWTFLAGDSREAFREALRLDASTWARARGWALWKALIILARNTETVGAKASGSAAVLDAVLAEHAGLA